MARTRVGSISNRRGELLCGNKMYSITILDGMQAKFLRRLIIKPPNRSLETVGRIFDLFLFSDRYFEYGFFDLALGIGAYARHMAVGGSDDQEIAVGKNMIDTFE